MADRTTIAAGIALVAILLALSWRTPRVESRQWATPPSRPATVLPRAQRSVEPPPESPEARLRRTLEFQKIAAGWLDAAIVTCRIPDVPEPNHVVVRYEPGWILFASDPQRSGDVFSFYVPPGPGRARIVVEAVGTWEVTWPDLVVGEVEPCSIASRAESSTVTGTVNARGPCERLVLTGCDSSSEVDDDGSFVLLDATPGRCELVAQHGPFGEAWCTPPTIIDVQPGETIANLSIDCTNARERCPDDPWFCKYWIVETVETSAMVATSRALREAPTSLRTRLSTSTTGLVRGTRDTCPAVAHVFDRIARDLELDLHAGHGPP